MPRLPMLTPHILCSKSYNVANSSLFGYYASFAINNVWYNGGNVSSNGFRVLVVSIGLASCVKSALMLVHTVGVFTSDL